MTAVRLSFRTNKEVESALDYLRVNHGINKVFVVNRCLAAKFTGKKFQRFVNVKFNKAKEGGYFDGTTTPEFYKRLDAMFPTGEGKGKFLNQIILEFLK